MINFVREQNDKIKEFEVVEEPIYMYLVIGRVRRHIGISPEAAKNSPYGEVIHRAYLATNCGILSFV